MTYNCLTEVTYADCDDEFFTGTMIYVSRDESNIVAASKIKMMASLKQFWNDGKIRGLLLTGNRKLLPTIL